jgi:hypothetical protein
MAHAAVQYGGLRITISTFTRDIMSHIASLLATQHQVLIISGADVLSALL